MAVNEVFMAPGTWDVTLDRLTPRAVLDRLSFLGLLVVTTTHIPIAASAAADLLSASMYTGVYTGRSADRTKLSGVGAAALLGPLANTWENAASVTSDNLDDLVGGYVLRIGVDLAENANGITEGTLPATPSVAFELDEGDSPLDVLGKLMDAAARYWKINPDLTLDVGLRADLFREGDVVLTPWWGGRDSNVTGYLADITVSTDTDDLATRVAVQEEDGGFETADMTSNPYWGVDGLPIERTMVDTSSQPAVGFGATLATSLVGELSVPRPELSASVEGYAVRTEIEPGDSVSMWDPPQGLVSSPTIVVLGPDAEIYYRGHCLATQRVPVLGMTWPVQQGMGVYHIGSDEDLTLTDLTHYVEWESGPTELELGALRRLGRAVAA